MRDVKYLIEEIREATENQDFSEFSGIKDREILRYINDAQERIQSQILKVSPKVFTKEVILNLDGSEYIDLPYDIFMGNKITSIKYRYTPTSYWERLEPDYVENNDNIEIYDSRPTSYIRLAGKIALRPTPLRGQIRVTYVAELPIIDLKRATVSTNINTSGLLDDLTLSILDLDKDALMRRSHLSIVNRHGEAILDNVKFDDINETTGEVTINGDVQNDVDLTGLSVVSGQKASTHSHLDEIVERYLIGYSNMKIMQRDDSAELQIQLPLVQEMEREIVESYAGISDDILRIPDIDKDFDEF